MATVYGFCPNKSKTTVGIHTLNNTLGDKAEDNNDSQVQCFHFIWEKKYLNRPKKLNLMSSKPFHPVE